MTAIFKNTLHVGACRFLTIGLPALVRNNEPVFEHNVKPILVAHCFKCHGLEDLCARLDLRTRRLVMRGGDNGPALKLNDLLESLLYKRVAREILA